VQRQTNFKVFTGILFFLIGQISQADDLTLYFFPSPSGINWTSPRSLAQSTVANFLSLDRRDKPHPIGHVTTEINCSAGYAVAGMTTAPGDNSEMDLIFKKGYGFGVLFNNFAGAFDNPESIMEQVNQKFKTGHVSYLRIFVRPSTCARVLEYYKQFGELGYQNNYGLPNRPRHREGGGCSAFATSILDVAGILEEDFVKSWSLNLVIPKIMVGGPLTGKKISFRKLYFLKGSLNHWDPSDSQTGFPISFYDPDRMHKWLLDTWAREKANPSGQFITERNKKSYGLVIDRTLVPTPTDSFWIDDPAEQILN
jgi:hypothetical protein